MYDSPNDLQRGMWEMWGFFDINVFYIIYTSLQLFDFSYESRLYIKFLINKHTK